MERRTTIIASLRRFVPGHGFKSADAVPCPDDTGSQLGYDGDRLYVSQFYNRRILSLDDRGAVGTTIDVPHDICGQVVAHGKFFLDNGPMPRMAATTG